MFNSDDIKQTHPTITDISIKLCHCCNGTYFCFTTIDFPQTQFFYLTEDELSHVLCDNFFKSFLNHCRFNIDTMQFDFLIEEFFNNKKNVYCMKEIFMFLYEQTVLNNNDY